MRSAYSVAIGLTLFEYSEELECRYINGDYVPVSKAPKRRNNFHDWTTKHDFATGRFCLRAYSPYQGTIWTKEWEIIADKIGDIAPKIAKKLRPLASTIAKLAVEAKKEAEKRRIEWEEQKQKWEIERKEQAERDARQQSLQDLMQAIEKYGKIRRIEGFFNEVELSAKQLPNEEKSSILERLALVRGLIGEVNALDSLIQWNTPEEILQAKTT